MHTKLASEDAHMCVLQLSKMFSVRMHRYGSVERITYYLRTLRKAHRGPAKFAGGYRRVSTVRTLAASRPGHDRPGRPKGGSHHHAAARAARWHRSGWPPSPATNGSTSFDCPRQSAPSCRIRRGWRHSSVLRSRAATDKVMLARLPAGFDSMIPVGDPGSARIAATLFSARSVR